MLVTIDIETIEKQATEAEIAAWDEAWNSPGNRKDPDKIKAKKDEDREKWLDKRKFTAAGAQIIAIGTCDITPEGIMEPEVIVSEDPAELCGYLQDKLIYATGLVGYNLKRFDIPIITAMLHKQRATLPVKFGKWDVKDLYMHPCEREGKLDTWLDAFGIKRTYPDMDGSMVQGLWDSNQFQQIGEYCKDDVACTAELALAFSRIYNL